MEITGTIEKLYNQRSGISQTTGKEWESVNMLIKITHQRQDGSTYDQLIDFDCMGDIAKAVNQFRRHGEEVKVEFNIYASEYNGRYYNRVRPSKVEAVAQQQSAPAPDPQPEPQQQPQQPQQQAPLPFAPQEQSAGDDNTLPF